MASAAGQDPRELLKRLMAQLPDFELEKELGQGGMGLVLLGTQRKLKRKVAVKLLFVDDDEDSQHISRFRREAKMYANLAHPNLVKIYDAGVDAEYPYLVLEYIAGKDLKASFKTPDRPPLESVALPLASAVAYVHEQGIVHRDIKSANVMLRENGAPVLMDFGLAKKQDPNATQLTEDGMRIGTPFYMPPEVLLGKGESGVAADVYCLGLVFYEVAIGKAMSDLEELGHGPLIRITRGLPKIEELGGEVEPALAELVEACIAIEPGGRPTAAEVVAQLSSLLAGRTFLDSATLAGAAVPQPRVGVKTLAFGVPAEGLDAAGEAGAGAGKASGRVRRPSSGAIAAMGGRTPSSGVRRPSGSVVRTEPPGSSAGGSSAWGSSALSSWTARERAVRALGAFVAMVVVSAAGVAGWRAVRGPMAVVTSPASGTPTSPAPTASASAEALASRRIGKDGQTFVLVPAGFFTMGNNTPEFPDEAPPHRVYLDAYYMGLTEVTNELYDRFCEATRHRPRERYTQSDPLFDRPDHPVVGVSWDDAVAYAKWAGQRLPTEAEWEKAARGTDGRLFPWGKGPPDGKIMRCNFSDSSATTDVFGDDLGNAAKFQGSDGYKMTSPVGQFPLGASPYGCLDMAGNVYEYCSDWYDPKYYGVSPSKNPTGPAKGTKRTGRGGSWDNLERTIRTVKREILVPENRSFRQGFRTAMSP